MSTPHPYGNPLVVLDADSTSFQDEVIELIAKEAGCYDKVVAITKAAMEGELDFTQSLHARVATFYNLEEHALQKVIYSLRISHGLIALINRVAELKGHLAIVSGGFIQVLEPMAKALGVKYYYANTLEIIDNKLSGKVTGKIIDADAKKNILISLRNELRINPKHTIAIGDGANDLEMMSVAGLSIAYCAKPVVPEKADICINEPNLALAIERIERVLLQD